MVSTHQVSIPGYHLSEQLYNGSRTLVYRGYRESDRKPVVIKMLKNPYPSFSELVQFRNQYAIAKNLNLPEIIQTYSLEPYQNAYALVMEFGGISLKEWEEVKEKKRESQSLIEFLQIAISLCNILNILYRHRIIHKDIKPANILINPETKQVKLIDFSIASLLPRETQTLISPNVLEGTLGYLSPEQTGRMNRRIDYRTDFYSLGVTFYELLTGQLPFQSKEPLELVHCHIAKQPPFVHETNPKIAPVLSEIISKLMAKNAENRYQSASGLKYDLETCLHQLEETGKIESFSIASRDVCDRFIIPEKLYGREEEVARLLSAFERIAGNEPEEASQIELMLVTGFSGIGKTAIVNEVHKPIVRQHGYFIKGKFDQFNRNIPFSAFVWAFRDLMGQLLSESDIQLLSWKTRLLQALGDNGQVIIEVIPELEQIIGQQPLAVKLSGTAAQNRFNLLFQKFIQVFTTTEHPLVIFLDDLQWADSASLKLMQLLLSESETEYLLLIGAYRDNEVSVAHPLMLTLEEISRSGATVNTITLAPLDEESLNQLVADSLSCSPAIAQPLTQLVYQKTKGNPFFSTQFLKALHEDGLIQFDDSFHSPYAPESHNWNPLGTKVVASSGGSKGGWLCDIAAVKALALTDDVVEFMALQLQKLPSCTQDVLKLAACIGNQFDLATLAIVSEQSQVDIATNLWKALQEGLILPQSEVYKFYVGRETQDVVEKSQIATYKFLHDRVQQAAYSLIAESQKHSTHLKIGQLLLANTAIAQREDKVFEIVNHLNIGVKCISLEIHRDELINLNLLAGKKAKKSTAYEPAARYLSVGLSLLAEDSWKSQYELTLALFVEMAEVAFLNGNYELTETLVQTVEQQAIHYLDQVKAYEIKIQSLVAQNQFVQSIATGVQVLNILGVSLSQTVSNVNININLPQFEDLENIPIMTNPNQLAAMRILKNIVALALIAEPATYIPLVLTMVRLSTKHGHSALATFGYVQYGIVLSAVLGDLEAGYHSGQLALLLLERFKAVELKCKVYLAFNTNIRPWKEHLQETLIPLQQGVQSGLETGDLEFAGYCCVHHCIHAFFRGEQLESLEVKQLKYSALILKIKQDFCIHYNSIWHQLTLNLQERALDKYLLVGDSFNEVETLPFLYKTNNGTSLFSVYCAKAILAYSFKDYDRALDNTKLAAEHANTVMGMILVSIYNFYYSLTLLALYPNATHSEQQQYLNQVEENQEKMRRWAESAPENYQHKYQLVEAEKAKVLGQILEAIAFYDSAIQGAKEQGYIQEEALANELTAKFYLDWDKEKVAQAYMQEAYYGYARWGAKAITDDLEKRYPQLLALTILQVHQNRFHLSETRFQTVDRPIQTTHPSSSSLSKSLDFESILKASQALSSEIQLEQFLCTLMQVAIENAGAKKAALLVLKDSKLMIQAIGTIDEGITLLSLPLLTSELIPAMLVNYVKNTLKTVVLDDATAQNNFIADSYLMQHQPKSILCAPILHQGKLIGILYLENELTIGAFTSDRAEVIQLLCAQAATSLENARLYQDSQNYAQQLERSLQNLQQAQLQMVQNEKMASLGNLVAGVAHEINNPLGFLKGSLNNIEQYIQDLLAHVQCYQQHHTIQAIAVIEHAEEIDLQFITEDLPKLVGSMKGAIERIKDISTSLRTFSRADTDKKVACNLYEGIESALLILKYRLKASEKRPAIEVIAKHYKIPPVKCFLGQLNQVFMNIFANAIDALDTASIGRTFAQMQANPLQILILTEVSNDQHTVTIRIKDNALGMPEEIKSRIFDHLFTTKDVGKGTGLGLAIARQIVEETHGGRLSCNSVLGEGTEFIIEIPFT